MRPSVHLVFGVDDFQDEADPRWMEPFDNEWFQTVQWQPGVYLCNQLYLNTEFGPPNVFGYNVAQLEYNNDCLWALAALNEKYQQSCAEVLPVVRPNSLADRSITHSFTLKHLPPGQRYEYLSWEVFSHRQIAMHLFEFVKFKAEVDQLKLMLVWEWS